MTRTHRVLIIGSGFGGLYAAKALRRSDVEVSIVAKTTHHLFQPLLYQVATGILSQGQIAPTTREILRTQRNAKVLLGEVTDIDLAERVVHAHLLRRQLRLDYDSLIVAAGASTAYFGHDEFSVHAPGMKSIDDALELRGRIFGAFELAELAANAGEPVDHLLTFVVVGAGPTGVEMAGQIAELASRTLRRNFRAISSRQARVILLDGADQVLGTFGKRLGARAQRALEARGVEVHLGALVTGVDERTITVRVGDQERVFEAVTKIWAAGVRANPLNETLAAQTGAELDRGGRIAVLPDLSLPGHPEVFVVGDMMSLDGLPGVAQVAIQGAKYAAKVIDDRVQERPAPPPFHYFDKGSMAVISRFYSVVSIGKLQFSGFIAWLMWLGLHLLYIIGFKNQVTTLIAWTTAFFGRGNSERAATELQVFGRQAMARLEGGAAELAEDPDKPD